MPGEPLVIDELQELSRAGSGPFVGEVIMGHPGEMEIILDFTGLRGSGPNIYYSLIYQLPKWNYTVRKVDEWIEVTPAFADYYNITIAQKQKLESAIKQGLTSATQAVADFELLQHDSRRYREIINYFKMGKKDEHVIRQLFVDRVDAHTGEGYSIVTMARRWPTIITDFIRMKTDWDDKNTIREELDVSEAEATVLLTKNKLFKEWKEMFFPVVKERYARIENLVRARRKSVDEYRNWLKPYINKFRSIKEVTEYEPGFFVSNAYQTPGFGQSQALSGVRLWAWKSFTPPEMGKPSSIKEARTRGFQIDPYDNFVKEWKAKIEKRYEVKISDEEVEKLLKKAVKGGMENPAQMNPNDIYYVLFDIPILLSLTKTPPPEGVEQDNLMFLPIKLWVMSQNALLIHILEIRAREKAMEKYINEIIGSKEQEEEILKNVEEEFEEKKKERLEGVRNFSSSLKRAGSRARKPLTRFAHLFIRPGPYEPIFFERVSKMYFRASGAFYGQVVSFIKDKMTIE